MKSLRGLSTELPVAYGRARRLSTAFSVDRTERGGGLAALPLHPLQLLDAPWPVVAQQARERTVGQYASLRLAPRAVVGLVLGVADALDRRAADRAGVPVPSMHRHPLAKGGHLRGEL